MVIEPNEWLVPIKNDYPALEKKYLRLEPTKMPMNKAKTEALASVFAYWLRLLDAFRMVDWIKIKREAEELKLELRFTV